MRVVLTTIDTAEDAERLARAVVERRLAACVNQIDGVRSIYRWEGRIEQATERLLLIKTSEERLAELRSFLLEAHPYDVPELVVIRPEDVEGTYLDWVRSATAGEPPAPESERDLV